MPTKPHPDIIPDYREHPDVLAILSQYASLIDETVNFGSHIFTWVFETVKKGDHHIAALSFYRRSLELLDSISVLIKNSCISPIRVLLRSLFEVLLALEYMTQKDLEHRGRDYILCLKYKEIDYLRRFVKGDPLHAESVRKYKSDNLLRNVVIPEIPNVTEAIKAREKLVKSVFYSSSEASYQEIKKARKGRNPKWWFNLHDGPSDIFDLAEMMGRAAQYEVMYRNWAGYAHGTGGMDEQVEIIKKDQIAVPQLRAPENPEFVAFIAMSYGLIIMRLMIREYAKDKLKDMATWYKKEIQAGYMDMKKKKIIMK